MVGLSVCIEDFFYYFESTHIYDAHNRVDNMFLCLVVILALKAYLPVYKEKSCIRLLVLRTSLSL